MSGLAAIGIVIAIYSTVELVTIDAISFSAIRRLHCTRPKLVGSATGAIDCGYSAIDVGVCPIAPSYCA
jgi:hypothetical protein